MKESYIESVLSKKVKKRGGLSLKIMPTIAGYPDRLVILPGPPARFFLVELKAPDGTRSAIQKIRHESLKEDLDISVLTLYTTAEVKQWLSQVG